MELPWPASEHEAAVFPPGHPSWRLQNHLRLLHAHGARPGCYAQGGVSWLCPGLHELGQGGEPSHLGRGDHGHPLSPGSPIAHSAQGPAVISDGLSSADRQTDSRSNATPSGLCRGSPETGSECPREACTVRPLDLPPLALSSVTEETYFPGAVLRAKGQEQEGGRDNRPRKGTLLGPDPGGLSSVCHWAGCMPSWTAVATWNSGARPVTSFPKIPAMG